MFLALHFLSFYSAQLFSSLTIVKTNVTHIFACLVYLVTFKVIPMKESKLNICTGDIYV